MILVLPSAGALLILLLVAFLFLGAPIGTTRSLIVFLINVTILILVLYFLLSFLNYI